MISSKCRTSCYPATAAYQLAVNHPLFVQTRYSHWNPMIIPQNPINPQFFQRWYPANRHPQGASMADMAMVSMAWVRMWRTDILPSKPPWNFHEGPNLPWNLHIFIKSSEKSHHEISRRQATPQGVHNEKPRAWWPFGRVASWPDSTRPREATWSDRENSRVKVG